MEDLLTDIEIELKNKENAKRRGIFMVWFFTIGICYVLTSYTIIKVVFFLYGGVGAVHAPFYAAEAWPEEPLNKDL